MANSIVFFDFEGMTFFGFGDCCDCAFCDFADSSYCFLWFEDLCDLND